MNKYIVVAASTLLALLFFWGCSTSTGQMKSPDNYSAEQHCSTLKKDLLKVDKYIEVTENTDAFHLEEKAAAIEDPDITTSTNKRVMLRDAKKLKSRLEAEQKSLGCK